MSYVKICGITRVEDALEAVRCGADAIGFVFVPASPRCVSPERAREIAVAAGGAVVRVGVFQDPTADEVRGIAGRVGLDYLQFHGRESPEFCRQFGIKWYKAFRLTAGFSPGAVSAYGTRCFLLDGVIRSGPDGNPGEDLGGSADHWERILAIARQGKMIVAGGLTPDNVAEVIRRVRPYGVDVSRGVEVRPGEKGADLLQSFVRRAREAERGDRS